MYLYPIHKSMHSYKYLDTTYICCLDNNNTIIIIIIFSFLFIIIKKVVIKALIREKKKKTIVSFCGLFIKTIHFFFPSSCLICIKKKKGIIYNKKPFYI
jgi:hypothetical protein